MRPTAVNKSTRLTVGGTLMAMAVTPKVMMIISAILQPTMTFRLLNRSAR